MAQESRPTCSICTHHWLENYQCCRLPEAVKDILPSRPACMYLRPIKEVEPTYTFILDDYGPSKIDCIKLVREFLGLGLKEAKDFVEDLPRPVREGVTEKAIDALRRAFAPTAARYRIVLEEQ